MKETDHAIVVGVSRYPGFGRTAREARHLEAPDVDATLVSEWLADPIGGGLPTSNIALIRSSDFPSTDDAFDARPEQESLKRAFTKLQQQAELSLANGTGFRVGRRLYVYMSGHGFAPRRYHAALFTANATRNNPCNVYASAWVEWFQDCCVFDEFVLWMDCCMERELTVLADVPSFRSQGASNAPGPACIMLAAKRPLTAVERPIPADGGRVHGIFTWALLQGLRGAATDETGEVNARGLSDFLANTMKTLLVPSDDDDRDIAREPEIVQADRRVVFASNMKPPKTRVTLRMPASTSGPDGALIRIVGGTPPKVEGEVSPGSSIDLDPGLYVGEPQGSGLQFCFEVSGTSETADVLATAGQQASDAISSAPADAASAKAMLSVGGGDPAAEVQVMDQRFGIVASGRGALDVPLPVGIYKLVARIGASVTERILLLAKETRVDLRPPLLASPAPLDGTAAMDLGHGRAERDWAGETHVVAGKGGHIFVMARSIAGAKRPKGWDPWSGITLVNARGQQIADLDVHGVRERGPTPSAGCNVAVEPGTYYLRQRVAGGEVDQVLHVPPDWRVAVYVLAGTTVSAGRGGRPKRELTILMHRPGQHLDPRVDRVLEVARLALADERNVLNSDMQQLLTHKFENPIAGILGAHLMLLDERPGASPALAHLNEIVVNLRRLVGHGHPDVDALSLLCSDPELHTRRPFDAPPMFARSWRIIVEASAREQAIVSASLAARVLAVTDSAPYLQWASSGAGRKTFERQLGSWFEAWELKQERRGDFELRTHGRGDGRLVLRTHVDDGDSAFRTFEPLVGVAENRSLSDRPWPASDIGDAARLLGVPRETLAALGRSRRRKR